MTHPDPSKIEIRFELRSRNSIKVLDRCVRHWPVVPRLGDSISRSVFGDVPREYFNLPTPKVVSVNWAMYESESPDAGHPYVLVICET
jgi:hypothetical protein